MPHLCELYTTDICHTTEEKAWKILSHGSRRVPVGTMKIEYTEENIHNNTIFIYMGKYGIRAVTTK